eukprot:TRINITY_DN60287_c0_g1_i1.p1 TRINITY_DN60287_c0_g1~~TRINITY_DN60287_c0_g1_i1.p1  ORF type:complete len:1057 (-),score=72.88 TRINITY_DN60287_c0_g1_i1:148-2955(-)
MFMNIVILKSHLKNTLPEHRKQITAEMTCLLGDEAEERLGIERDREQELSQLTAMENDERPELLTTPADSSMDGLIVSSPIAWDPMTLQPIHVHRPQNVIDSPPSKPRSNTLPSRMSHSHSSYSTTRRHSGRTSGATRGSGSGTTSGNKRQPGRPRSITPVGYGSEPDMRSSPTSEYSTTSGHFSTGSGSRRTGAGNSSKRSHSTPNTSTTSASLLSSSHSSHVHSRHHDRLHSNTYHNSHNGRSLSPSPPPVMSSPLASLPGPGSRRMTLPSSSSASSVSTSASTTAPVHHPADRFKPASSSATRLHNGGRHSMPNTSTNSHYAAPRRKRHSTGSPGTPSAHSAPSASPPRKSPLVTPPASPLQVLSSHRSSNGPRERDSSTGSTSSKDGKDAKSRVRNPLSPKFLNHQLNGPESKRSSWPQSKLEGDHTYSAPTASSLARFPPPPGISTIMSSTTHNAPASLSTTTLSNLGPSERKQMMKLREEQTRNRVRKKEAAEKKKQAQQANARINAHTSLRKQQRVKSDRFRNPPHPHITTTTVNAVRDTFSSSGSTRERDSSRERDRSQEREKDRDSTAVNTSLESLSGIGSERSSSVQSFQSVTTSQSPANSTTSSNFCASPPRLVSHPVMTAANTQQHQQHTHPHRESAGSSSHAHGTLLHNTRTAELKDRDAASHPAVVFDHTQGPPPETNSTHHTVTYQQPQQKHAYANPPTYSSTASNSMLAPTVTMPTMGQQVDKQQQQVNMQIQSTHNHITSISSMTTIVAEKPNQPVVVASHNSMGKFPQNPNPAPSIPHHAPGHDSRDTSPPAGQLGTIPGAPQVYSSTLEEKSTEKDVASLTLSFPLNVVNKPFMHHPPGAFVIPQAGKKSLLDDEGLSSSSGPSPINVNTLGDDGWHHTATAFSSYPNHMVSAKDMMMAPADSYLSQRTAMVLSAK